MQDEASQKNRKSSLEPFIQAWACNTQKYLNWNQNQDSKRYLKNINVDDKLENLKFETHNQYCKRYFENVILIRNKKTLNLKHKTKK